MVEYVTKFVDLVEKYWRHHRARFLVPAGATLLLLALITDYGKRPLELWHVAIAALTALAVYAVWIWENRVPEVPKGRVGFVLALMCDDEAHDKQVRADFVAHLRQLLHSDQVATRFSFLDLPKHHARACQDGESAARILARAQGHFLLYGAVRKRTLNGRPAHLVSLEGVVRHAPVPTAVSDEISADFRAVLPRRLGFSFDNDAFAFEATSEWAELAARYVIGLAAFASGDVWYAEKLLLSVEQRLRSATPRIAPLQNIVMRLPSRLEALYATWLRALSNAYIMTRSREFVEAAEPVANKLLARDPSHYNGLLQAAVSHFVLRRDVVAAKRAIMACRRIRDVAWRYSLAFLLAYEGNVRRAREEYNEAFQGRLNDLTLPIQCEEFIHLVLEQEPEKGHLLFFSALINEHAKGDTVGATRDYEAFLASSAAERFPEEAAIARRQLRDLYGVSCGGEGAPGSRRHTKLMV